MNWVVICHHLRESGATRRVKWVTKVKKKRETEKKKFLSFFSNRPEQREGDNVRWLSWKCTSPHTVHTHEWKIIMKRELMCPRYKTGNAFDFLFLRSLSLLFETCPFHSLAHAQIITRLGNRRGQHNKCSSSSSIATTTTWSWEKKRVRYKVGRSVLLHVIMPMYI